MNKKDYMKDLAYRLRRLPKEDYDRAMEYFEEYFEEAGEEFEAQAIRDLGSPKEAANELILNLAAKTSEKEPGSIKHKFSAIWIGVLALFASPVALPLAVAAVCVLLCVLLSLFCMILGVFLATIGTGASGIIGLIGGIMILTRSFPDGLATIGISLFFIGAGGLLSYLAVRFSKWLLAKLAKLPGKFTKGGRKHEIQ